MAITGTKSFTSGSILTAADVNQYLMRGIKVFADATTRASAYGGVGKPTLEEGEASYLLDSNQAYVYDGTQWVPVGGDWTGTVASATSVAVLPNSHYLLTGTTQTNTATGGTAGARLTITASGQAAGACVVIGHGTGAGNFTLRDSQALGIYAGESLQFVHNGTAWVEVARNLKAFVSYAQITTNYTTTATTEATATDIVSVSTITYDGVTPFLFELFSPRVYNSAANYSTVVLHDGATARGQVANWFQNAGASMSFPLFAKRRYTPTAGSFTFRWRGFTAGGTLTLEAGAGGAGQQSPAYLRVTRDL